MTDTDCLAALLHETETPWGPSMSGDSCPGLSAHGGQAARLAAANVVVLTPPPDNRVAPGQPNPVAPASQPSATAPATALREALDREQRAWMVHGDRWEDEEVGSIIDRLRAALEADHD